MYPGVQFAVAVGMAIAVAFSGTADGAIIVKDVVGASKSDGRNFNATPNGGLSFISQNHTVTAGTNQALVVSLLYGSSVGGSGTISVKYGGVDMTLISDATINVGSTAGDNNIRTYYLLNPTPGTATLEAFYDKDYLRLGLAAVTLENVLQQAPEVVKTAKTSNSTADRTTISATYTTLTAGALALDVVASGNSSGGFTPAAGLSEILDTGQNNQRFAVGTRTIATPSSVTDTWNVDNSGVNNLAQSVTVWTAIPEPASLALLGAGGLLLLPRRRRA